jgi:outer membrane protein OmpA-like peptidoglycan-associated protein
MIHPHIVAFALRAVAPAEPSAETKVEAASPPAQADAKESRWILRHRPHNHEIELGIFGGVMFPSRTVDLREIMGLPGQYANVAPEFGLRLGYYPIRFFGMEGEVAAMPVQYEGTRSFVYAARAQGVLQAGWWRIVPFVSLGGGVLGVTSRPEGPGQDADPALTVGGGLKLNASRRLSVRIDVRDIISGGDTGPDSLAHSPEVLATFAIRFGVKPKPEPAPPPPPDFDTDGVPDADDWCPREPGKDGKGCPFTDDDCDGVTADVDKCPDAQGVAPDGCPPPDEDGDGIVGTADACPNEAGVAPDGCPLADADGDGISGAADKCPDVAETANGFEDDDGCADELPEAVREFSGTIEGIVFDNGKAVVKPASEPVLTRAVALLQEYPQLRLEIVGHTDDRGQREANVRLSEARAAAVRKWLVDHGVAEDRLTARGAGPDSPVESNATAAGRAKNRRIEFALVK